MTTELTRRLVVFTCFLVTAVTLIPVVMMVLVAFQSDAESMAASPSFWPSSWHPENLERAFGLVPLGQYLPQHRDLRGWHAPCSKRPPRRSRRTRSRGWSSAAGACCSGSTWQRS